MSSLKSAQIATNAIFSRLRLPNQPGGGLHPREQQRKRVHRPLETKTAKCKTWWPMHSCLPRFGAYGVMVRKSIAEKLLDPPASHVKAIFISYCKATIVSSNYSSTNKITNHAWWPPTTRYDLNCIAKNWDWAACTGCWLPNSLATFVTVWLCFKFLIHVCWHPLCIHGFQTTMQVTLRGLCPRSKFDNSFEVFNIIAPQLLKE